MTNLPENWAQRKLDAICSVYQSKTISTKELVEDGRYAVYGANGEIGRYNKYNHTDSEVLITCRGATCGRINVSRPFSWINGNAMVVHPHSNNLRKDFLYYYLTSINFAPYISGSAQPQITRVSLQQLKLPLPPLAEQGRIVAKIEELFAGIDAGIENLKSVKNQIALYRQSVLKSAFEKTFKNVPLVEITSKIGSGSTPKGGKENYQQSGIPIIRSMNVLMNNFTEKGLAFLNDAQAKALNNVILKKNDVLLNITGASIGRTCVLPEKYIGARVNQHVSIIRPKKEIDSFFLSYFLSSPKIQAKITLENYGATRQALTKSALEAFQIPVPTLAEQEKIVAEIESRFERADALETAVDRALNDAEKLKQAVLKKAFSGELVPQNPDDEPASVLLDRIRAARASELPAKKGKRKKTEVDSQL